jgi:hypothetical protein
VSATRRSATSKISVSARSSVSSTSSSLVRHLLDLAAVPIRRRSIESSETICA